MNNMNNTDNENSVKQMDADKHASLLYELDELSKDSIKSNGIQQRKKKYAPIVIRMVALLACAGVFVYCVISIVNNMLSYAQANDYYSSIVDKWNEDYDLFHNPFGDAEYSVKDYQTLRAGDYKEDGENVGDIGSVQIDSNEWLILQAKLSALKAQNSDFVCWIEIPDTTISYPVVQTVDNDYYLHHSFNHEYLLAGAVFMDYRNSPSFLENYNSVIYGHNLSAGTMFHPLCEYFKESFYEEHREILISTFDGVYVYKVFNVSKVSSTGAYIRTYFTSANDFLKFVDEMQSNSIYSDPDIVFNEDSRLLTLSTCTNAHRDTERYCIQAVLVEIRK